ncbi:Lsr2 family protein [Parafrankia sp. EUN1f]|uniref:histone-like nucleoid-structuring protein Lsr2 n=1 Tax=Parafrankia sp. EUN1f TaxID=102897 RepID=UPI0001C452F9|nr:Lsr2 family protein [Parafrankia sp. EUN1f]EFC79000.1 hypothetical protein FrEUN1fDRAFT_7882 [Parafrankia sp. EUN1f]
MAQKTVISLIDDITGEAADETVRFGLDGAQYEIDVTAANAAKLREALAPFVSKARRATSKPANGKPAASGISRRADEHITRIRNWARANGYQVSDRGRMSKDVVEAYNKAQRGAASL